MTRHNKPTRSACTRLRTVTIPLLTAIAVSLALTACHSSKNASGTAATSRERQAVVKEAHRWLGTRYRYGGTERSGVDCSGMVMRVYDKAAGVKLPRSSAQQQSFCKSIKRKDLAAGDLLFFTTGRDRKQVSHVGIYIGHDKMIHASASRGVITSNLNEKYYADNYHSSGRITRWSGKTIQPDKLSESPTTLPHVTAGPMVTYPATLPVALPDSLTPPPHTVRPSVPVTTPDSTARPVPTRGQVLDDVLDQKIDSIYGSWLD
ncbi:MAG: NlpC/P60 family protein [Pseudoflavonifractor sp.]|nr:NlpC/P60 family protein [Pseudoflavonifractor sp.]